MPAPPRFIARRGSSAPRAAHAALSDAAASYLESCGVPALALRSEAGERFIVGALPRSGRMLLLHILGPGAPAGYGILGPAPALALMRLAGARVIPVHDQLALVALNIALKPAP